MGVDTATGQDHLGGRDHRLGEVTPVGEPSEPVEGHSDRPATGGPDEVVACGERPIAGADQDRHPQLRIGEVGVEHLGEFGVCRRMQRVQRVGPVDRHLE
jgi:hypothetical protein